MSKKHVVVARAFDKRGKLLAQAANSYTRTHPLQAHFAKLAGQPLRQYLHAEMAVLIKSQKKVYKVVVERYNRAGEPVLAKPCPICQLALTAWDVKVIEHT